MTLPDGFTPWTDPDSALHEQNIRPHINEISPFARLERLPPPRSGPIVVDTFYGLAFDFAIPSDAAIYGRAVDLPEYSGDRFANRGFLRTPFRKIPRILVRNGRQLRGIIDGIARVPDLELLFRGQNREYLLSRSPESLLALYGDPGALEPSLLPSAVRAGVRLEDVFPQWLALLQVYLDKRERQCQRRDAAERYRQLRVRYEFGLLALALAQHYGLPSVGLDVTPDLDVALFFALHTFRAASNGDRVDVCRRKGPSESELSVIYVLCPRKRFRLGYDEFRPPDVGAARPDAQRAHFLHSGWGLRQNAACENLFLALYLDPAGDFGRVPGPDVLFPSREADGFGGFIADAATTVREAQLQTFLRRFRWVQSQ